MMIDKGLSPRSAINSRYTVESAAVHPSGFSNMHTSEKNETHRSVSRCKQVNTIPRVAIRAACVMRGIKAGRSVD